ncbi:hypothetical protein GCM10009531_16590 [Actinoplanes capillaceus]
MFHGEGAQRVPLKVESDDRKSEQGAENDQPGPHARSVVRPSSLRRHGATPVSLPGTAWPAGRPAARTKGEAVGIGGTS